MGDVFSYYVAGGYEMADDIGSWLEDLDLAKYAHIFVENEVGPRDLPHITDDDLKELGLPLGPRKRILGAIDALIHEETPEREENAAAGRVPSSQAERRQLTVMFCDLVGSTELSGRLDPEDLSVVMRHYQDAVSGCVARYGGHVAKFLGDGVLAYFGWPQAYEDQAERAVRAGLDAVEAVGNVKNDGLALAARIGIASGEVVVGELSGESGAIVGETPNLAARLQGIAEPGQVVIGATTRRLVGGGFETDEIGARTLKGFADPVRVWRALGEKVAESRFEATHTGPLTNLIGRDQEIDLLYERWERAKQGEGQVVLLSGEAGIGKSRITQSLRERIAGEPHFRLRHQCAPYYAATAFHPFIRQFEFAAGLAAEDDADTKLDKLETLLRRSKSAPANAAPLFAALLSLPTDARYGQFDMTPQQQKGKTIQAIGELLSGLAAERPVIHIFEDAHWADPTSLEVLDQLIGRISSLPVLEIITFRPEFAPPWRGHANVTALALNRLGKNQCADMVARVTGGKALPEEVLEQIVAKTDGVPLFVEELTKTVMESGILEEKAERFELNGPLPPLAIPSTLQDSLMARLDRLAPVKEVAQIGAAIGREFSHRLLTALVPSGDNELQDAIPQLIEAELIFRRGGGDDTTYVFKHALVQDAAYESLLKSRRQELHRRIATVLEQQFPETAETEPEILGHHFTAAGLHDEAIEYWLRAGRRAARSSANTEAVEHLNQGLALLDKLPKSGAHDARELDFLITLLNPLIAAVGYSTPEMARASTRALELCRQLDETARIFPVLYGQWVYYFAGGDVAKSCAMAADFLDLAERQQDQIPRMMGHRIVGAAAMFHGEHSVCRAHNEQSLAEFDPNKHASLASGYGQDLGAAILSYLSMSLCLLGYPDQAVVRGREALARARAVEHANTLAYTLWHVGTFLWWLLDDSDELRQATEEMLTVAAEPRMPIWTAAAMPFRGEVSRRSGKADSGLAKIEEGLAVATELRFGLSEPVSQLFRGQALHDLGRTDEALQAIAKGLARAERRGEHWIEPELLRVQGELSLHQGDPADAEVSFQAAIALAEQQDAKWWKLRTATSLARVWLDQGRHDDALDLLAPVYNWFTEGFDTRSMKEAKALLDELA